MKLKLKGRLVIEQTNITESLHHCGIVDFGFLNNVKPRVNKDAILAIKNAPLFIMGPGSEYTSLMSLLLVPEVVEALRQRVADNKENLFIFNAVRDNETVDNKNISDIVRDIERVTGLSFGKIFNKAVVNDIESLTRNFIKAKDYLSGLGESSPDYAEAKKEFDKYSQMFSLMDEMEDKKNSGTRNAASFSKLAKYSRGEIGFDENDLNKLIASGVEVYKTKVILSSREVRKEGKAGKEVSVRYDNAQIANIFDQILWKKGALFKHDENLSTLKRKLISDYFDNNEEEFNKAIERVRNEGILKSRSPAEAARYVFERLAQEDFSLSEELNRSLLSKKVIITNLKHTLCMEGGITPRIKEELELFLKQGGKLVVISGFELPEMRKRLLDFIDKDLWDSIILVANYGTEAWYWDKTQKEFSSLFTSFYHEAGIGQDQKDRWMQIVENTSREYGLEDYKQEQARVEDRGTMIALRLGSRRYLQSLNMITLANYRLQEQSLPLIADDGILRTPMVERLNRMFDKYELPVTAVLGGTGTINTMVKKAANKGEVIQRVLWAAKDKGLLPQQNLEQKLLIMGKGNYEIAKRLEADHVPWVVFQAPRNTSRYIIEFKKKYGVKAAEEFLEQLNSLQSSLNPVKAAIKSSNSSQWDIPLVDKSI